MITFIGGMFAGATLGVILFALVTASKHEDAAIEQISAVSDSLNREKKERAERLKELERQHNNMMDYTGKEQKRA